jgi:hypothetical protein
MEDENVGVVLADAVAPTRYSKKRLDAPMPCGNLPRAFVGINDSKLPLVTGREQPVGKRAIRRANLDDAKFAVPEFGDIHAAVLIAVCNQLDERLSPRVFGSY